MPNWSNEVLEDEKTIFQTLSTFNSSKDTAIESSNPMTNFGSDETVNLGSSFTGESKILISFNNTVPGTDLVTDAILKLTCGVDPLDIGVINIYNSRLLKSWDEDNATWSDADNGVSWQLPGAEGSADYESWEPPFYGYANNTFSINVTAVVQDAVANSRSSIDLVLAATGTQYDCQMSETQNFGEWPYLQITHQTGTHTNGGSLSPNFVEDGAALMDDSQFVLSAATNPELSWDGLTGNHAQVQLSMSNNFFSMTSVLALSAGIAVADVPKVAVDIAPVHSLVSKVMNGLGEPKLIIPAEASPHDYQLRPSEAKALQEAKLVFWIGEDLTPWLEKGLSTLASEATITALLEVDGIKLLDFREGALFEAHDHYAGQYVVDCNIARSKLGTCKIKQQEQQPLFDAQAPFRATSGGIGFSLSPGS